MQRFKMIILGMQDSLSYERYLLRIHFNMPLANALSVNAKAAIRADRDILGTIETSLTERCQEEKQERVGVWDRRKKQ